MDRTVPRTGSEEIELYIRTYYSLLRARADVQVRTLEEVHANMGSSLHLHAQAGTPDLSAFIYASLRLPDCIVDVERVVLGQSAEVFRQSGVGDVETWQSVEAKARRRRSFCDGAGTMACFIASGSDIDDILPILTSFQIEWNKFHRLLRGEQVRSFLEAPDDDDEGLAAFARGVGIEPEDMARLRRAWADGFWPLMRSMAAAPKRLAVRLLAGSLNDYRRATQLWWGRIAGLRPELSAKAVYFVSSNTHSLVNLVSGFALRHQAELVRFIEDPRRADLLAEWNDIQARAVPSSRENFLYYVLKKYLETPEGQQLRPSGLAPSKRAESPASPASTSSTSQLKSSICARSSPSGWTRACAVRICRCWRGATQSSSTSTIRSAWPRILSCRTSPAASGRCAASTSWARRRP